MDNKKRVAVGSIIHKIWQNTGDGGLYIKLANETDGLAAQDIVEFISAIAGGAQPGRDAIWGVLRAALDRQLVAEHVAAQLKMSDAADKLQRAGIWLAVSAGFMTFVGLGIGIAQIVVAVHQH